ncbi:hypothetical protein [Brachybacterium paraconglomeratum]|uniref:hypothetical protein n=1 Tax=Brachybacterium paraconglomeratum TaxID=173362 RepID=UPI0021A70242|nr:hypothetical protein [Brachybacterium paraconglomeratum]MCT1909748.1 hypothetical protein [Brachybacterium paraconglomeratum]
MAAFFLAVWILTSQDHWALRPGILSFSIRWVVDLGSGLIPLTLALGLVLQVPLLRRPRRADAPGTTRSRKGGARYCARGDAGTGRSEDSERVVGSTDPPAAVHDGEGGGEQERLRIPGGPLPELGAQHRWEMAEALGITWRVEFVHDHQGWAVACLEAVRRAPAPAGRAVPRPGSTPRDPREISRRRLLARVLRRSAPAR